jgi:broad specificity phosphatase PhoE
MPINVEQKSNLKRIRLYIIRHGKTEMNQLRLFQGSTDSPLNEIGLASTKALRDRLLNIPFDIVYVSPLGRTIETYKQIVSPLMPKMEIRENLKEFDFGIMENTSIDEASKLWPESFDSLYHNPENHIPVEGSETVLSFNARVHEELISILNEHTDAQILIVTHGVVMRSMMLYFLKRSIKDFWIDEYIPSTSLLVVDFDGEDFTVIKKFDNEHTKDISDV